MNGAAVGVSGRSPDSQSFFPLRTPLYPLPCSRIGMGRDSEGAGSTASESLLLSSRSHVHTRHLSARRLPTIVQCTVEAHYVCPRRLSVSACPADIGATFIPDVPSPFDWGWGLGEEEEPCPARRLLCDLI